MGSGSISNVASAQKKMARSVYVSIIDTWMP